MALGSVILRPDGDSVPTDLNAYPTTPHYVNVDEVTSNGDTDYVYTGSFAPLDDVYTLQDVGPFPGPVDHVDVTFVVRRTGADGSAWPLLVLGGTEVGAAVDPIPASYTTYTRTIGRPGGGTWTWADIAVLEVGIRMGTVSSGDARCTQLYATVYYELLGTRSFTTE